jgi:hypothetical protein
MHLASSDGDWPSACHPQLGCWSDLEEVAINFRMHLASSDGDWPSACHPQLEFNTYLENTDKADDRLKPVTGILNKVDITHRPFNLK